MLHEAALNPWRINGAHTVPAFSRSLWTENLRTEVGGRRLGHQGAGSGSEQPTHRGGS